MNFFSEKWAEVADPAVVAWYIGRDVGKERQKTPPEEFGRVRPWWGAVGMERGEVAVEEIPYGVFVRMYERLEKWNVEHGLGPGRGPAWGGIVAPMLRGEEGLRMLSEVEAEVAVEGLGRL